MEGLHMDVAWGYAERHNKGMRHHNGSKVTRGYAERHETDNR